MFPDNNAVLPNAQEPEPGNGQSSSGMSSNTPPSNYQPDPVQPIVMPQHLQEKPARRLVGKKWLLLGLLVLIAAAIASVVVYAKVMMPRQALNNYLQKPLKSKTGEFNGTLSINSDESDNFLSALL